MKQTLRIIGNIFASPREAFTEIKQQPTCFLMFLLLSVVSIGSGWAVVPYYMYAEILELGAETPQVQVIAEFFISVGFFVPPLPLLIKCLIFAGLLYLGARFLGNTQSLTFKPLFAAVVYSELILVLAALINAALLLYFKETSDIKDATDLHMIPSLHLILGHKSVGIPYFTFLSQMNPFSVWYLLVLARGVAIVGDLSRRTAEGLVVFIYLAGVGVQVAIAALDAL